MNFLSSLVVQMKMVGKNRSQEARSSWRGGIGRHFTAGNQDEGRLALVVKNLPASAGDIRPRGQDPLEEGTATHSTVLAWIVPWTQEPGGLQSIGSQRAGHN